MNLTNYKAILANAEKNQAQLVAVSKTRTTEDILKIYHHGQRVFGENRVPELVQKAKELPLDIKWHLIGHLQRNKVKEVLPYVDTIHSIDSIRLINEIQKQASKINKKVPCLIQMKIAQEASKYGFEMSELAKWLDEGHHFQTKNIEFIGLMGMATFTNELDQVRVEFKKLHELFAQIKTDYFNDQDSFKELSMGMSGDYLVALEEGSTIIRVGSSIFGSRA